MNLRNLFRPAQTPQDPPAETATLRVTPLSEQYLEQARAVEQLLNTPMPTATQIAQRDPVYWLDEMAPVPDEHAAFERDIAAYAAQTRLMTQDEAQETEEVYPPHGVGEPGTVFTYNPPATNTNWTTRIHWTGETITQAAPPGVFTGAVAPGRHRPRIYGNIEENDPVGEAPTPANPSPCIPLDHPVLAYIRSLVPPALHNDMWVGGSAACKWGQHGDVDVWLGYLDREPTEGEIALMRDTRGEDIWRDDEQYPSPNSFMLHAGVAPDGTKIHIMGAHFSMRDVLEDFDISCHACIRRLVDGGEWLYHEGYTSFYVRLLGWTSAKVTLERGIKFSKRYDDQSFWAHPKTQQCAAEACRMPYVTPKVAEMLEAMQVEEGL